MAKKHSSHIAKPVYPGGMSALKKFVASQLRYPAEALKAKVEGTVTVRYGLDYRGKVVEAKIKKGLGYGCDAEALRVVKLLQFNVPQSRKKKVRIHQDLNIHFKLPSPTPAKQSLSVSYTSTKTKKAAPARPAEKPTYGYTIKW